MKCQNLFSEKNKTNISVCCLLKIFPRVLSVNQRQSRFDRDSVSLKSAIQNCNRHFFSLFFLYCYYFFFSEKIGLDITCYLSTK